MTISRQLLPSISLLIVSLLVGGCAILNPRPQVLTKRSSQYQPQRPTNSEQIEVVDVDDQTAELPEGIEVAPEGTWLEERVRLERDFPTAEKPHVLVGQYNARDADRFDKQTLIDAMTERAAQDGANMVLVNFKPRNAYAIGVRLSDESAPEVETRPAEELLGEERARAAEKGYETTAFSESRELDNYEPLEFEIERGTCYWMTFALAEDAALSSHARRSLGFGFETADKNIRARQGTPLIEGANTGGKLERTHRSGSVTIGCPQQSVPLTVDMQARFASSADKSRLHELGEGEVSFEVHTKPISDEELAAEKERMDKKWKEAKEQRLKKERQICRKCSQQLLKCGDSQPASCKPYRDCISRNYGTLEVCTEGL